MKKVRFLALAAVVSLGLTGCSGSSDSGSTAPTTDLPLGVGVTSSGAQTLERGEPQPGGSLTAAMNAPVESLDPAAAPFTGAVAMRAIFDSLFVYDDDANVVPELAESIETTDEGKTWTMKLPSGVTFTDGTDFNADAVIQHLTRLGAEGSQSRSAGDVRTIESMESPDPQTVVFTLREPNILFPRIFVWGQPGGPGLIPSPTAVATYGDQIGLHPVGVGPFKLKSFQSGGDIVLEKNEDYRIEGQPYLDEIRFVTATDTQSRLSAAIAGDIDLAPTQSGLDLRDASENGLVALHQPQGTYYDVLLNLSKPPFDDVRVRTALAQAISLDALNQTVFEGLHTPMTGIFPETNPAYIDTDWPGFDPDAAAALVAEYTAETGNDVSFTLTTTSPPEFQRQAALIQQMLDDVGIKAEIAIADQPSMVTDAQSGNFDSQLRFADVRAEAINQVNRNYRSGSPANYTHVENAEIDAVLDKLLSEGDGQKRFALLGELQEELTAWMPIIPLLSHELGWYVGDKVGGFPGNRVGIDEPDWRLVWALQD